MRKEKRGKDEASSQDLKEKAVKDQTFEQKKRAAYSAMGKIGGLARAKQMAEEGFIGKESKKDMKNKMADKNIEKPRK